MHDELLFWSCVRCMSHLLCRAVCCVVWQQFANALREALIAELCFGLLFVCTCAGCIRLRNEVCRRLLQRVDWCIHKVYYPAWSQRIIFAVTLHFTLRCFIAHIVRCLQLYMVDIFQALGVQCCVVLGACLLLLALQSMHLMSGAARP